jgi:CRP-like cAMP-binding protein
VKKSYSSLREIFEKIVPLEEKEWQIIREGFSLTEVPAKQFLTSIGDTEKHVYFVVKGILRLFCHTPKGEEVTIFLFKENFFASSYQSFLTQLPSEQALESMEKCALLAIHKHTLDEIFRRVAKMNLIARVIAEQRFIHSQSIFTSYIMNTPEERYLRFEKLHGDLLLRVPHHIIASFLGITPVSMSRIRKRILSK